MLRYLCTVVMWIELSASACSHPNAAKVIYFSVSSLHTRSCLYTR